MADAAACPSHPTQRVVGSCARCGSFICQLDSRLLDGKLYCATCAARTDVDWLEGFKRQHWGKRDGWAWLFGIGAPVQLATAVALLTDPPSRQFAPFVLAAAVGGVLWWLKIRAARWLLVVVLLAQGAYVAALTNPLVMLGNVVPLLILASVALSARTKLFFEIEVPRDELQRLWDIYANNLVARYALSLGLLGLLIWPLAPFAVICGIVGLSRVDPNARPPIGRKGSAIAGVVLGFAGVGIAAAAILIGDFR